MANTCWMSPLNDCVNSYGLRAVAYQQAARRL